MLAPAATPWALSFSHHRSNAGHNHAWRAIASALAIWLMLSLNRSGGSRRSEDIDENSQARDGPHLVVVPSEVPPNCIPRSKDWTEEDDEKNPDCNRPHCALQEWWVVIVRATGRRVNRHRRWNSCSPSR